MTILDVFAQRDTELRQSMLVYIREHFSELLGPHVRLLDEPQGLDVLADMLRKGEIGTRGGALG